MKKISLTLALLPLLLFGQIDQSRHSLFEQELVPGRVVEEQKTIFGATKWTLSNGIEVYLLSTENNSEQILMNAFAWGGSSSVSDDEFSSVRMISSTLAVSGVGDFSATELSNYLAEKFVYITPTVGEFFQNISCATNITDLGIMLRLMRLYFVQPRFDREAFDRTLHQMRENIIARENQPFSHLQDSVVLLRSNKHPRTINIITNLNELEDVDFEEVKRLHARLFGNPQDYTFVFVGALDLPKMRPLIEKYIGSLQNSGPSNIWRDLGRRPIEGVRVSDFTRPIPTAQSTVFIEYTKEVEYSIRKVAIMSMLQQILEMRYMRLIGEIDVEGSMRRMPTGGLQLIVSFQASPELIDDLIPIVRKELERIVREGVDEEELQKSRELSLTQFEQRQRSNFFWSNAMRTYIQHNINQTEKARIIPEITAEDVRALLEKLVKGNNVLKVIMRPE